MQITWLCYGSSLFKTMTHRYLNVPSAAIEMILTFQCPFELFSKVLPVTPQVAQAQYMSVIISTYIV